MKFLVQERWSPGPHIFSLCYRHGRLYDAFTCHLATAQRKIHNGKRNQFILYADSDNHRIAQQLCRISCIYRIHIYAHWRIESHFQFGCTVDAG